MIDSVRAFAGAIGPAAAGLRRPRTFGIEPGTPVRAPGLALWPLGHASPTLAGAGPAAALVKGRPFALVGDPLALLQSDPARGLVGLDGKFALCAQVGEGRLVIATDLLGIAPLYYADRAGTLYFATHLGLLLDLLPEPPALSRRGVAAVLAMRGHLDGETHFEGVRRLRAAEHLVAGRNPDGTASWILAAYADPADVLLQDAPQGAPEEILSGLVSEAIRRHPFEGGPLLLSSGLDSRALACLMPSGGDAVTFGRPWSSDLVGARTVARRLGLRHRLVPYDRWRFDDHAKETIEAGGGAVGLQAAHFLVATKWAAGQGYRTLMMGFLGDALAGKFLGQAERIAPHEVRQMLFPSLGQPDADLAPYQAELQGLFEEARSWFHERRDLAPHRSAMLVNLTRRQAGYIGTSFDALEWHLDLAHPLYHRDLIRFWLARPFEEVRGQALYERWIARLDRDEGLDRTAPGPALQRVARGLARRVSPPLAHFEQTVSYREVTARSQTWLRKLAAGQGELAALARRSIEVTLAGGLDAGGIPVFCQALPMLAQMRADPVPASG